MLLRKTSADDRSSERLQLDIERLDIASQGTLEFFQPDMEKFTCIKLAYEAGRAGGTAPAILNVANDVVEDLFLHDKIAFVDISRILEEVLGKSDILQNPDISSVIQSDKQARAAALEIATTESASHA